jgi:glycosyltransferase involved in cell wall biosynthesis
MPAIGTSRNTSGMVSIITPTYNRATFLKNALAYFRSQNYRDIEWLILDDSLQEAPAFSDLADRNIFYERIDRKLSVGEKRNLLIEKSHGEIIVQFDDDDYYCPGCA